jgi:hypothetical protein
MMISYYYYEERRGRLRTRSDVGAKLSLKRVSFFYDDRNVSVREWWCSEIHRVRMLLKDPSKKREVVVFCALLHFPPTQWYILLQYNDLSPVPSVSTVEAASLPTTYLTLKKSRSER